MNTRQIVSKNAANPDYSNLRPSEECAPDEAHPGEFHSGKSGGRRVNLPMLVLFLILCGAARQPLAEPIEPQSPRAPGDVTGSLIGSAQSTPNSGCSCNVQSVCDREPDAQQVVQMAREVTQRDAVDYDRMVRAARRAGWAPTLRLDGSYQTDAQRLDETRLGEDYSATGETEMAVDDHGRESSLSRGTARISLTWDLGRAAWAPETLALADRQARQQSESADRADKILEMHFQRLRLMCDAANARGDEEAAESLGEADELRARLDASTGDAYSALQGFGSN